MHFELQAEGVFKLASAKQCQWGKIHEVLENDSFMEGFCSRRCIDNAAVVMTCLQLCEALQSKTSSSSSSPVLVNSEARDIINYIGGAVIRKLKGRYTRLGLQQRVDQLSQFQEPTSSLDHTYFSPSEPTLIQLKTRGGLVTPTTELSDFLCGAYSVFKGDPKCNSATFVVKVSLPLSCDDACRTDILKLFHKILIHHECKLILERYKIQKKLVGKGKALRNKLSDKNSL